MTDERAMIEIRAGLAEIRETRSQYGVVHVIVSGGAVRFVNVEKPAKTTAEPAR